MWGSSEEPPGTMEAGPPETVANLKETCEQSKNQLESVKDIMLRNKQSLKKKEEELQEYAKKLTKFKTRAKTTRSNKDDTVSSSESTPKSKSDSSVAEPSIDVVDDISQAKTPKAKSSLLQKKLAEDRKIFEQRSKELTESKRAVEEKVEALRQQFEEKYVAPVSVVSPVLVTSQTPIPVMQLSQVQDKDNKIAELNNKIYELEATIIDLQENLKEKDSVIDSKTRAVTLMSADLSKKGKTTLDTLEDTKDEMRSMQENFVLVETSLRSKNDNLLKQLEAKNDQIDVLEENIQSLMKKLEAQKEVEAVNADFSRSTMDTLADTKDAMKSMQENFVLIESSLKSKNEHLLKQLEEREMKLAEAEARILHLEVGVGIERQPNLEDLTFKIEKLEETNRNLQDEKYELQKSIADLQDKIISSESSSSNNLLNEKDNRIAELESFIEEIKKSNQSMEESLQNQIADLNKRNQEMSDKIIEFQKQVVDLESEKIELSTKLTEHTETEVPKEDERVQKLTKELDELNKSMIKLKAQHKNKLKTVQKQLENFKKVSDKNAELVKLGNQVALLEEEKASAGDWQKRISDLEGKVSAQAKEIQTHIEAIAILENQKLELMQELHAVKQEVSSLEAENAESENLRVTAEMKVVDLEEELESLHKRQTEPLTDSERSEFQRQVENLTRENERLSQKISKLEELKGSSEVGSTESFVKTGSNVDSTESFEALAAIDADKADLLKKIDGLTRENGALLEKLTRFEEKGSSDTGSTESFERIPEQGESTSKLEILTRENYELVVKLTKLEEKLAGQQSDSSEADNRLQHLAQENERLMSVVSQLQERLARAEVVEKSETESREKRSLEELETTIQAEPEGDASSASLSATEPSDIANDDFALKLQNFIAERDKLMAEFYQIEKEKEEIKKEREELERAKEALAGKLEVEPSEEKQIVAEELQVAETAESTVEQEAAIEEARVKAENETIVTLEKEIERCNALINEQKSVIEDMKTKLAEKEEELEHKSTQIASESEASELDAHSLRRELEDSVSVIAEWKEKCAEMETKMEALELSKRHIEEAFETLQSENRNLLEQSELKDALVVSLREELNNTISGFEAKLREQAEIIVSQEGIVLELRSTIESKDQEMQSRYSQLQTNLVKIDELQEELIKLRGLVQQRDATIASLTEEVEVLTTNMNVVEEDLFTVRQQLSDEKLETGKKADEYEQAIDRLKDKEMLIAKLEGNVYKKNDEVNNIRMQAKALADENQQLRDRIREEEQKVADLLHGSKGQEEALRRAERAKDEVEHRLLELQAMYEEHLQHAKNTTSELQETYKMLEKLKMKHTEDMEMLNRRLEDVIEEVEAKTREISSLQDEITEKNNIIKNSVAEEVHVNLLSQISELEKKLSEADEKAQAQLEKMKKYAAVAKKKTAQCEELETKLHDLEEKWNLEKSEKEARNRELQESVAHNQEKDNRISDMEEELQRLRTERDEALQNMEAVKIELNEARYNINTLNDELKELSESKDRARELGVRMEVMETEYVEQIAQINSLQTQNGFLLSKQAQITERLEIVEKESEERRVMLEKLEKEKEIAEMQRSEAVQESCGQCATRVQALEAKLQERDAEIENLDNELHNSIGNLVQMQENLRLSTIPSAPDYSLQESYNELMVQYNTLTVSNEDMKAKYEAVMKDNEELRESVGRLQQVNATMQERIETMEREITRDKEAAAAYDNVHKQYIDLMEQFDKQKAELVSTQAQLNEMVSANEASQQKLLSRIELLEHEKQELVQEFEKFKSSKENVVPDDDWGLEATSVMVDVEAQQQQQEPANEISQRQKREVNEFESFAGKEDSPVPLFDASVFGAPTSQVNNPEQEMEIGKLKQEVSFLNAQMEAGRNASAEVQNELQNEIKQARERIQFLTEELNNVSAKEKELEAIIVSRDNELLALQNDVSKLKEALNSAKAEYEKLGDAMEKDFTRVINDLLSSLSIVDESSSHIRKLQNLGAKIGEILLELEAVRAENQQLQIYKSRVFELENEVKATSDSAIIAELEMRIARVISERDILQLQVTDVTRAYEDLKESTQGLKNLQSQLQAVSDERNELAEEVKKLRLSKEQEQVQASEEISVPISKAEELTGESMWEDDEDPWGFNDKTIPHVPEQHVDIPIIPSAEMQLRVKVDELEDKLREVGEENAKLIEEAKTAQIKNIKYVKKLKEYKVQFDSLQRQLKTQKSMGGLGADLDFAIEEELKAQIANLEKALSESKDEMKKVLVEKESLLKRIDVLTAATERFTEAKEKQDTEVHIWQMRYKDLEMKFQQLNFGPETKEASSSPPQETEESSSKYEAEIKELKDNIEALAIENEELQHLLEENRTKRQTSIEENNVQVQELQAKNAELTANIDKLKNDYDHLRKQYEQSLMDANDQVQNMRQNCELLKRELGEKTAENEKITGELNERLNLAMQEKGQLEIKIHELESDVGKLNSTANSLDELSELLNTRVQEVVSLKEELNRHQSEKTQLEENTRVMMQQLTDELNEKQAKLENLTVTMHEKDGELVKQAAELEELRGLVDKIKGLELSIEGYTTEVHEKNEEIQSLRDKISKYEANLAEKEQQVTAQQSQLQQSASRIQQCTNQEQEREELAEKLAEAERHVSELNAIVAEKTASLERSNEEARKIQQELHNKEAELEEIKGKLEAALREQSSSIQNVVSETQQSIKIADDEMPMFTFGSDNNDQELQKLRAELKSKEEEIEHLQYSLNESSMTRMIQGLQDNVNSLYNEKCELENQLSAKNQEISAIKSQLEKIQSEQMQQQHRQPRKRSLGEQEELMKLQNELHEREQQMNELNYVAAEKESHLRAALHELEGLQFTVSELQSEVANLRGLERLAANDRATIEKLSSEKEEVRLRAEEAVENILQEKEREMDALKQQLAAENQNLIEALGLRERDLENLKLQIEQTGFDRDALLEQKTEQLARLEAELSERDRRVAELSITKDTEIHNLRVQLSEKSAKLEELIALSEEEERQLAEMRNLLETKEIHINKLTQQLQDKSREYELIQQALQRHVGKSEQFADVQQQQQSLSGIGAVEAASTLASNQLDLALYRLHQRDMRCEELTLELMQLLEERDTLQLRLSNAIRVNEELKAYAKTAGSSPRKDSSMSQGTEPVIEDPSPSRSEGPVEIAKEAIHLPISEDQKALAQKLSQLKTVNQARDVRLRDERELRHSQMSLLVHGNASSTTATELVHSKLPRGVLNQSNSSLPVNRQGGKSTSKVLHM